MAYVPPDAKWYLADLVIEFAIESEPDFLVHVNLCLVRADSPEEAYEKAMKLGTTHEATYTNPDGNRVDVHFKGLRDLYVIYEDLEDGAEILYEELTDMDENAVAQLVRPKNKLAVFEPGPE